MSMPTQPTNAPAVSNSNPIKRKLRSQRLDFINSLDWVLFAAFVQMFYLDHSIVQLVVRSISQMQYSAPALIHPTRSLAFFAAFLAVINLTFIINHLVVPLPLPRHSGLVLDFIGQDYRPPRLTVFLMDLFIACAQAIFLIVAYDSSHREIRGADSTEVGLEDGDVDLNDIGKDRNPYSRAIINLRFRPTLRRLLHARPPTVESVTESPPESQVNDSLRLTSRGRANRAQRAHEGLGESRLDDIADEERGIGVT